MNAAIVKNVHVSNNNRTLLTTFTQTKQHQAVEHCSLPYAENNMPHILAIVGV